MAYELKNGFIVRLSLMTRKIKSVNVRKSLRKSLRLRQDTNVIMRLRERKVPVSYAVAENDDFGTTTSLSKIIQTDMNDEQINKLVTSKGFCLKESSISGVGLFYCSDKDLPANTYLGEYGGEILSEDRVLQSDYIMQGNNMLNIDAKERNHMLKFINDDLSRNPDEADFKAFTVGSSVHIFTTKVFPRTGSTAMEKFITYGFQYWYPHKILSPSYTLHYKQVIGFNKYYGHRIPTTDTKFFNDLLKKAILDQEEDQRKIMKHTENMRLQNAAKRNKNSKKTKLKNKQAFTY